LPSGAAAPLGSTSVEEDSHDGGSTHGWSKEIGCRKEPSLGRPACFQKPTGCVITNNPFLSKLYRGPNFGRQPFAQRHALAVFGADTTNDRHPFDLARAL
jgi:hypothetical protein